MKSFSDLIKEEISVLNDKPKMCCCFSVLYGAMCFLNYDKGHNSAFFTSVKNAELLKNACDYINTKKSISYNTNSRGILINTDIIRYSTIVEIEEKVFKCPRCKENFLKGLYLSHGTISDPYKTYRMDLSFDNEEYAEQIKNWFSSIDLNFKKTIRKNKFILYSKDSDTISDFLALIGANNSVYSIINSKIEKELRNDVNRVTNCDSANINKSVNASLKYCEVIEKLKKEDLFDDLPDNLKEMANIRFEYDNLNFTELGKKFNPPISKSGVYHRLEKIIEFYNKTKKF